MNQKTFTGGYGGGTTDIDEGFSELAYIISQMQKVRRLTALQVTDDLLLDAAVRLHITTQINKQRPMRGKNGKTEQRAEPGATEKQLKYIKNLGAHVPEKLTKSEASKIIEELKEEGLGTRKRVI